MSLRTRLRTPASGPLEVYPSSDREVLHVGALVRALGRHAGLHDVLAETLIVVSPPRRGLDAIPEIGRWCAAAEGVCIAEGLDRCGPPAVAVRSDSVLRWDLGLAHEVLHLYVRRLDDATQRRLRDLRDALVVPGTRRDEVAGAEHLLVYFGQWYLAGYGALIARLSPDLAALCGDVLGSTRVADRGTSEGEARVALAHLARWFRTGASPTPMKTARIR